MHAWPVLVLHGLHNSIHIQLNLPISVDLDSTYLYQYPSRILPIVPQEKTINVLSKEIIMCSSTYQGPPWSMAIELGSPQVLFIGGRHESDTQCSSVCMPCYLSRARMGLETDTVELVLVGFWLVVCLGMTFQT